MFNNEKINFSYNEFMILRSFLLNTLNILLVEHEKEVKNNKTLLSVLKKFDIDL